MKGKNIGLALQGGGSYAAFTAGVLKAMFDSRESFLDLNDINSVTGTSGGALNAMLLGLGIHERQENPAIYINRLWELNKLEKLLKDKFIIPQMVSDEFLSLLIGMNRRLNESNPYIANAVSEYSKNNSFINEIIDDIVHHAAPSLPKDIDAILFPNKRPFVTVVGTEVKSAQAHYFTNNRKMIEEFRKLNISKKYNMLKELTLRGIYASLAHPNLFSSVRMGDDIYWDGYYTSNPPFFYLFREGCDEVFLIRLIQRNREEYIGNDLHSVNDRAEEIIQNTTLNMEIQMYFLMRELLIENKKLKEGAKFKLGTNRFNRSSVYHEIRLLKPGNIADEGYPLADFVDKLLRMGEKAMTDKDGFISTFKSRDHNKGLQVISEISFENEAVSSYIIDMDDFIFGERGRLHERSDTGAIKTKLRDLIKKFRGLSTKKI